MKCNECGNPTVGTYLVEQADKQAGVGPYFLAPLCARPECVAAARAQGAIFMGDGPVAACRTHGSCLHGH